MSTEPRNQEPITAHSQVHLDESVLSRLVPLDGLSTPQRQQLVKRARLVELAPGEHLGECQDERDQALYLLEGQLELFAGEQLVNTVIGGSEPARFALSPLVANELHARAKTFTRVLAIERELIEASMSSHLPAGRGVAREAPAASVSAPMNVEPGLQSELALAKTELEAAFRDKVEATVVRRLHAGEIAMFGRQPEDGGNVGAGAEAELRTQQKILEAKSASASQLLAQAQRRKLEIEEAIRAAGADAVRQRASTGVACEELRHRAKARLEQEHEHLQAAYSRAAKEIAELKRVEREAEARFQKEQERLQAEIAQSRRRIEAEIHRIRDTVEAAKLAAQKGAERIRAQQSAAEERLRAETESKLQAERAKLEAEFAHSVAQFKEAQQALKKVETMQGKTQGEIEPLAPGHRGTPKQWHAVAVKATAHEKLAHVEAEYHASPELPFPERNQALRARPQPAQATVPEVTPQRDNAKGTQTDAENISRTAEEKVARERAAEEELRVQLYAKAEESLQKERIRSEAELEKARRLVTEMGRAGIRELSSHNEDMLAEIQSQLDVKEENLEEVLRRQAFAERQVLLTRSAQVEATAEKENAKLALQRAREHITRLKEQVELEKDTAT